MNYTLYALLSQFIWYNRDKLEKCRKTVVGEEKVFPETQKQKAQELQEQYEQNFAKYSKFCSYLEKELHELIKETKIPYYELSCRIKTWESILEKIERNSLSPHAIQDIHDVIGFRIITLFKRDIPVICETIREHLSVVWEDDKAEGKPEDVFGYLSVHFQIELPSHWLHTPSSAGFSGIQAELQVRTFSQHVWAASSHLLQYKRESAVPYTMRRNIYRLAAVLEIVDNELESILSSREAYQASLKEMGGQDQDHILDSILLEQVLDDTFAKEGKKSGEPFDDLLQELFFCNVKTVGQLSNMLSTSKNEIQRLEQESPDSEQPFYSYTGKLRIAMRFCFPDEYTNLRVKKLLKG